MRRTRVLGAAVAAALVGALLAAPDLRAEPGDDLVVYALTFGPGDHPFFKFGHNAILIQPKNAQGLVYNFGTFAFDSPALLPKFLRGRFMYWLSVSTAEDTLQSYASANRSILAQELDLTPAQRWGLWQALRINARPENREYLYDYFYDNCSTRVRDAIDRVVGGRVRAAGRARVPMTFRDHALRMTADLWPEAVGIDLGLGRAADVPLDRWDESFLPDRLAELLRLVRIPDGNGEKSLVKTERVIHRALRPPKPSQPPNWTPHFLAVGLVVGGALFGLGRLGRSAATVKAARRARSGGEGAGGARGAGARDAGARDAGARGLLGGGAGVLLGCTAALIGLVFGFIGLALVCLWAFTDHRIAYANANIIQFAPWSLALLVYGIGVALGRPHATKRAQVLTLAAAAFSLSGLVCKILPGPSQSNWPFVVLCLPVWVGLWAGLRQLLPGQAKR
jgi:hypothetical protein